MSLYASLLAGVSGLKAQTMSMSTVSDNIANVSTIGYKKTNAVFSTLVSGAAQGINYAPGGVAGAPRQLVNQQGVLQSTQRATDVAIVGSGFFVVKDQRGEQFFTRAGSFNENSRGQLQNAAGYLLQGWKVDQAGNIIDSAKVETVAVSTESGVAADTKNLKLGGNLDARAVAQTAPIDFAAMTPATFSLANADEIAAPAFSQDFSRTLKVFDTLGNSHNVTMNLMKIGSGNDWAFALSSTDAAGITGTSNSLVGWGTLSFNGDGTLAALQFSSGTASPAPVAPVVAPAPNEGQLVATLPIDWLNGSNDSSISIDFGGEDTSSGFAQFAADFNVQSISRDGAEVGLRTGVSLDNEGFVVASYSNGATQKLWKIPVATFANPNELEARKGSAFGQTTASGEFTLREANKGGAGRIEPLSLEGSNVDLSEEFTQMITTQRAYSAATKIITTADEMLDELLRVKR
jgi:flagellar hook protein FlgE